ncbi:hypothetical protein TRICI_002709 [Trichomonascus ciferrii]|uniref:Uncharacterized protein n=1 Tax=Trichomonascus ciferrii TaxID=44093 RepID=A0A642V569_9ASCO|nr:hypothetical protein TRICI_002709 [Trichomonascus ciferrii]
MAPEDLSSESKAILRRFDRGNNTLENNTQVTKHESSDAIKELKRNSDALVKHATELKTRIAEYNSQLEKIKQEENDCRKLMNQVKYDVGITDETVLQELNYLKQVSSSFISSIQN